MTTMSITTVSPEARDYVLANLWQRGREELDILGISEDAARGIIQSEVERGSPTWALWIDERPVVVMGLMLIDEPFGMRTWFQATDDFNTYARAITQQIRDSMSQFAASRNLDFIEIVSPCVHPQSGRWFKALGFELDLNRYLRASENNDRRLYRFERRFVKEGARVLL